MKEFNLRRVDTFSILMARGNERAAPKAVKICVVWVILTLTKEHFSAESQACPSRLVIHLVSHFLFESRVHDSRVSTL